MAKVLQVTGVRENRARIDQVGDRARRPEPALRSSRTLFDLQMSERRKFARGRFKRDSAEWVREKRRRGLDPRTMRATGRLESALENATDGVRMTVFNSTLTWGIPGGRSPVYYGAIQAQRGRNAVVIDRVAVDSIAYRVGTYISEGEW